MSIEMSKINAEMYNDTTWNHLSRFLCYIQQRLLNVGEQTHFAFTKSSLN